MSSTELKQQDTVTKRKLLLRSDAVVGDDDNKVKPIPPKYEPFMRRSSTASHQSKDSTCKDSMGVNVLKFIKDTLHKNPNDRQFLLNLEEELRKLVTDDNRSFLFFPKMTSYNRMLAHRVAAFFGLIHNVDQSQEKVVVTKQKGFTRLPDITFSSLIEHNNFHDNNPFMVNRRSVQSFDETHLHGAGQPFQPRTFRGRFNTDTGANAFELMSRGRRAHSFETADWYSGTPNPNAPFHPPPLPQQQQQQLQPFMGRQHSGNTFEPYVEGMSSNCSSNASSSAIPGQFQSIHLPIYQPGQFFPMTGNEAAMLSPSSASAYSEPPNPSYAPMCYKPVETELPLYEKDETANNGLEHEQQMAMQQQQHPHIPSLMSMHPNPTSPPLPLHMFTYPQQQFAYAPQYQEAYYQYQPIPMVSPTNPPPHLNQFNGAPFYYQNYYPVYQPQPHQPQTIVQPHPLLEENKTRHLEEHFRSMNIDSAVPDEQETDREHLDKEKAEEKENGQQQEVADAASEKQPNQQQQNYGKRTDTGNKGSNEKQNQ